MKKNTRSIRNYLIRPKSQLRFSLTLMSVSSIALIAITFISFRIVTGFVPLLMAEARAGSADLGLIWPDLKFVVAICALSMVSSLALGILYSHRFYGPLIPLLKQIEAIKSGDFSVRGRLRQSDEMKEVMTALNELAESLQNLQKQ
jgi:methyl-accepting chemotaxis protein